MSRCAETSIGMSAYAFENRMSERKIQNHKSLSPFICLYIFSCIKTQQRFDSVDALSAFNNQIIHRSVIFKSDHFATDYLLKKKQNLCCCWLQWLTATVGESLTESVIIFAVCQRIFYSVINANYPGFFIFITISDLFTEEPIQDFFKIQYLFH